MIDYHWNLGMKLEFLFEDFDNMQQIRILYDFWGEQRSIRDIECSDFYTKEQLIEIYKDYRSIQTELSKYKDLYNGALERIKVKDRQIEELSKSIESLNDDNKFLRERLKELRQGKRTKMDYTKTNGYKEAIRAAESPVYRYE